MERYSEQIKALEELKVNILANVSHELRTPITIAKGAIELAEYEEDPRERNEYLNMALNALARLSLIVEDIIGASKFMKGDINPKFDRIDMRELVELVCRDFSIELQRTKIKLQLSVEDGIPPVRGDRDLLRHALRNLLSNAIKFNREGGSIHIRLRRRNGVEVCISDTGIGIPEDKIDRIFDVLYQVDSSPTRRYGGTGLGLAIVKEIVEVHGGRVSVESRLGAGSTFCVSLPAAGEPGVS
ncbi:MAG: hypothetical protein GXO66_10030 [Euryarchaeota archaeon]|nr:hypothetical protein [Euryarchaeota archaeon]